MNLRIIESMNQRINELKLPDCSSVSDCRDECLEYRLALPLLKNY